MKTLFDSKSPRASCAYIAPTYSQAKRVAWDMFKEYTKSIIGTVYNESELKITFPNKKVIHLLGAENYDAIRGMEFDGVIIDEVANMPHKLWGEIIRPTLMSTGGTALFIGTPQGKNRFYDIYKRGLDGGQNVWYSKLLTLYDTDAFPEESEDATEETWKTIELEYTDRPEEFEQEMMCSFTAAVRGAYYKNAITKIEESGRLREVLYDTQYPVITSWDIGFDATVIWYAQLIQNKVCLIACDWFVDEDIPEVCASINSRGYNIIAHLVPFDAADRNPADKTLKNSDLISNHTKIKCYTLPKAANGGLSSEINAVRTFLSKCIFDRVKTEKGYDALTMYSAKIDTVTGVNLETPKKDDNRHGADSFRYLVMGLAKFKNRIENKVNTKDKYIVQADYNPLKMNYNKINTNYNPYNF